MCYHSQVSNSFLAPVDSEFTCGYLQIAEFSKCATEPPIPLGKVLKY